MHKGSKVFTTRAQESEIVKAGRPNVLVRLGLPRNCEHLEFEVSRYKVLRIFVGTWQSADDLKSVVTWLEDGADDLGPLIQANIGSACSSTTGSLSLRSILRDDQDLKVVKLWLEEDLDLDVAGQALLDREVVLGQNSA